MECCNTIRPKRVSENFISSVHIYSHEVAMFSLSTVWETILTRHTRITRGGWNGAREDRSAGWSPQAHSSHVVGCTSYPASRFDKIHCSGRKRRSFMYCPHHLRRRAGETRNQLRHDLHVRHDQTSIMV